MTPDLELADGALVRRALLIGVATGVEPLRITASLDAVARRLTERHGFVVARCEGPQQTTRAAILARLDAWVAEVQREGAEVCLLYYFGHGGRVRFTGFADHELGYVACERRSRESRVFEGVLGLELSLALGRLADPGRSVVAILDCCFSGAQVRSGRRVETSRELALPDELAPLLAPGHPLALESHPTIVRLAGASAKREAFARKTPTGHVGVMTRALLDALDELGEAWPRATWDALARRVRQKVIDRVGEGQWVGLAGPGDQLLFSPRRARPRPAIGLVADERHAWLRAGLLQGVEVGDRWALGTGVVDREGRSSPVAIGRVIEVELSRARLELEPGVRVSALRSNLAWPHVAAQAVGVAASRAGIDAFVLDPAWLCASSAEAASLVVSRERGRVVVEDRLGVGASVACVDWRADEIAELLVDKARGARLLAALARAATLAPPLACLPLRCEPRVVEGRLWLRVTSTSERAQYWFVHLIYLDAAGRPWLLNTRAAQGLELERGSVELLGERPGAQAIGLTLPWTSGLETLAPNPTKLVVLVTSSPLELDPFVRAAGHPRFDLHGPQGLGPVTRGTSRLPESVVRWAISVVDLEAR